MVTVGRISEIWRYPVKSIAGERIDSADLDALGIPGDRRLALRNLESGKIISAKVPKFGRELLALAASLADGGRISVTDAGVELGEAGSELLDGVLTERLGVPVRIEAATTTADEVYESYWPEIEGLALSGVEADLPLSMMTAKGTFVDLAALHLVSSGSLRTIGDLLPDSVISVNRFRPSIVIDSAAAEGFVENAWTNTTATLGEARIAISSAAPRCVMTTLEQPGLPADKAVLQTLATENRVPFAGLGDFACLGVYAEVVEPGRVAVGDELVLDG